MTDAESYTPDGEQQPDGGRRRRNPVYHVFELIKVKHAEPGGAIPDLAATPGKAWVQIGEDISAATDTDAIAQVAGTDESVLDGRTFWAPLVKDYRPRTRAVENVPKGRWT